MQCRDKVSSSRLSKRSDLWVDHQSETLMWMNHRLQHQDKASKLPSMQELQLSIETKLQCQCLNQLTCSFSKLLQPSSIKLQCSTSYMIMSSPRNNLFSWWSTLASLNILKSSTLTTCLSLLITCRKLIFCGKSSLSWDILGSKRHSWISKRCWRMISLL